MIRSMTAFSKATVSTREGNWVVEIRSLNHRYFEFSLKIPSSLNALESKIRDFVHNEVARGKVMVSILLESDEKKSKTLIIDDDTVKLYVNSSRKIKKKYQLDGDVALGDILKLPGVFTTETVREDPEKAWPSIKRSLKQALESALDAKKVEGQKLADDIHSRLEKITKSVARIEKHAEGRADKFFKRLQDRVDALLKDQEKDPDRVHREVAIMAERSDITEELVRLRSHLELFGERLKKKGEVGRELDFLCQELNREINTMGSKSQLFDISTEVVAVKGEIEKIREQVQNIE